MTSSASCLRLSQVSADPRGAGGEAGIDHDHDASFEARGLAPIAIDALAALQLAQLARRHVVDDALRDAELVDGVVVQPPRFCAIVALDCARAMERVKG